MEFVTPGGKFYPERLVPVWCGSQESLQLHPVPARLRLILIEQGSGVIRLNGRRLALISPSIFCLGPADELVLQQDAAVSAKVFYFHPAFINSSLTMENIRTDLSHLQVTDRQDAYLLQPFVHRTDKFFGQLLVAPAVAKRISGLHELIAQECRLQPDWYWPCRVRSYCLELLLILERVFQMPESWEGVPIPASGTSGIVEQVLLYLHTNYHLKTTVTELCRMFHIDRTTLQAQFKAVTGDPVLTYLIKLRIRLACLLLKDTEIAISELAERLGFDDSAHFSRTFRKHTRCSPTDYRQQFCWLLK